MSIKYFQLRSTPFFYSDIEEMKQWSNLISVVHLYFQIEIFPLAILVVEVLPCLCNQNRTLNIKKLTPFSINQTSISTILSIDKFFDLHVNNFYHSKMENEPKTPVTYVCLFNHQDFRKTTQVTYARLFEISRFAVKAKENMKFEALAKFLVLLHVFRHVVTEIAERNETKASLFESLTTRKVSARSKWL